jgi:hypothetical protein
MEPKLLEVPKSDWTVRALLEPALPTTSGGLGISLNLNPWRRWMVTTRDGHSARTVEPNNAYANKVINLTLHVVAQVHDIAAKHGKEYELTHAQVIRYVYETEVETWHKTGNPAEKVVMITRYGEFFEKVMRGFNPPDHRVNTNMLLSKIASFYAKNSSWRRTIQHR